MTLKAKIAAGLITTLCSGVGTYELLRDRGGRSLNKNDEDSLDEESEQGDKDLDIDDKVDNPSDEKDLKPNQEGEAAEKSDTSQEKTPEDPIPKPEPKNPTYREYIRKQSPKVVFVDNDTSDEVLQNILLHRMFPQYKKNFVYHANKLFTGNTEFKFDLEKIVVDGKHLHIIKKHSSKDFTNLRTSCVGALNKNKPDSDKKDPQIYKIKAWCTVPTIKQNLQRHKFVVPTKDSEWQEILKSEWITNNDYHNKQSFFNSTELDKFKGTDESAKLKTLKDKCTKVLDKNFARENFPFPKSFLDSLQDRQNKKVDEFQEAALFCTVPKTAKDYITEAIKGVVKTNIPDEYKQDYCYEEGKTAQQYGDIKTIDPMGGKSFWCAVRMIYDKALAKLKQA